MSIPTVDVFVSGAGPVGLFFAYQMATLGHTVYCVDPKPGPTDQSRAILITSRTMEILEEKCFASAILSEAVVLNGIKIFRNGVETDGLDAQADSCYPHATVLMQGTTEKIFNDRLNKNTDCRVDWETELSFYTQEDGYVSCTVQDVHTREVKVIHAKYIVGADGTHSKVRKGSSDWTYEGTSIMTKFYLADLTIKGEQADCLKTRMNTFMKGSYVMGLVRLNPLKESPDRENKFRVFGNTEAYLLTKEDKKELYRHGLVKKDEPPSLEYIQEWIDKMTFPMKLKVSDLDWSSFFRINERIANGFRRGRAFLAGDAAHCHSPAGGQGMNLGLQDADNLAWKMSHVLKGLVANPEELLDSYSIEREPHAKSTIETTGSATKTALTEDGFMSNLRGILISAALMVPQIRRYAFNNTMQLNVTVNNESKLIGTSDKGLILAGQYFPDTGPLRKSFFPKTGYSRTIERKSLREILVGNTEFVALFIDTCHSGTKPHTEQMEMFWTLTRNLPIRRIIVRSAWHCHSANVFPSFVTKEEESTAEESFYTEERIDLPMSVTNRIVSVPFYGSFFAGNTKPCVVMILRPDLYIANAEIITDDNSTLEHSLKLFDSVFPQGLNK
ncbi:hypothetical protein MFLAVUS_009819 [Mucor flavus]|uniref:FAD-binding domain-containing protein n=1 Tax=Mucor flavus TaxID=439312 RepID=A0ABP9ZB00_9FUNG